MKIKFNLLILTVILIAFSNNLIGQTPTIGRSWQYVASRMPESWYGSNESVKVAENVLLYQRDLGGWPKNIDYHLPLDEAGQARILGQKGNDDAIFDNGATTTEMNFMARMYNKTWNNKIQGIIQ